MTTKTVTDYKTEEVQREITECDIDGCTATDEEQEMLEFAVNPRYSVRENKRIMRVLESDEDVRMAQKHIQESQMMELQKERYERKDAFGMERNAENARAAANVDVCSGCLTTLFGIDVPTNSEVDSVDVETGGIDVHTTVEKNPVITMPWDLVDPSPIWAALWALFWLASGIALPLFVS